MKLEEKSSVRPFVSFSELVTITARLCENRDGVNASSISRDAGISSNPLIAYFAKLHSPPNAVRQTSRDSSLTGRHHREKQRRYVPVWVCTGGIPRISWVISVKN